LGFHLVAVIVYRNRKKTAISKRRNNTQNNTKTTQKQRIHKIENKQLTVQTLSIQSHQYHVATGKIFT